MTTPSTVGCARRCMDAPAASCVDAAAAKGAAPSAFSTSRRVRPLPIIAAGQLERDQLIGNRQAAADGGSTRGGNHHVLRAVLAHVGHRSRVAAGRKLRHPQFTTGLGVEGAEAVIVGRADEDEAAGGGDAAAEIARAGLQPDVAEFGQRLVDAQRRRRRFPPCSRQRRPARRRRRVAGRHLAARQPIGELLPDIASPASATA